MSNTVYKNEIKKIMKKNQEFKNMGILIRTFLISGCFFGILVIYKIFHSLISSFLNISLNPLNDKFQNNIVFSLKMGKLFILYSLVIETLFYFIFSANSGKTNKSIKNYLTSYGFHIVLFAGLHFYLNYTKNIRFGEDDNNNNNDSSINILKFINILILLLLILSIIFIILFILFSIKEDKKYVNGYISGKDIFLKLIFNK